MLTAASRFCPAVLTSPIAVTTPDTALVLKFEARVLTAVWSSPSADFSALTWACHWPRTSFTKAVRFAWTSLRSALISLTVPFPTLTCLSLSSEAPRAAASAHAAAFSGEAAGEAGVDDGGAAGVDDEGAADVDDEGAPLPDPQAATSSANPGTTMTNFHQAALDAIPCFISLIGDHRAGRLRLTRKGLFRAALPAAPSECRAQWASGGAGWASASGPYLLCHDPCRHHLCHGPDPEICRGFHHGFRAPTAPAAGGLGPAGTLRGSRSVPADEDCLQEADLPGRVERRDHDSQRNTQPWNMEQKLLGGPEPAAPADPVTLEGVMPGTYSRGMLAVSGRFRWEAKWRDQGRMRTPRRGP